MITDKPCNTKGKLLNPGSDAAIRAGCSCAVLDNRHGLGAYNGKDGDFWISDDCSLHGKVKS